MEDDEEQPQYSVDICVTCVTDKPPKLPLREELPSLGVELVYNANGIGSKATQHESKKAVRRFRTRNQIRDMKKVRLLPKTTQRVKEKIAERKLQEVDLATPHALSYEDYDHELQKVHQTYFSSSSSGTSDDMEDDSWLSPSERIAARYRRKQQQHLAATTSSPSDELPSFEDLLAPADEHADLELVVSSSTESRDESSISSRALRRDERNFFDNLDIRVVASAESEHLLPGLTREGEDPPESTAQGYLDEDVKHAFATSVSVSESQNSELDRHVEEAFAAFKSTDDDVYGKQSMGVKPEEAKEDPKNWMWSAFDNVTDSLLKATGMRESKEEPATAPAAKAPEIDPTTLFDMLGSTQTLLEQVEKALRDEPTLAMVRRHEDGRLALHAIADRGLPDRSNISVDRLCPMLIEDVHRYLLLIQRVKRDHRQACMALDKAGDLPVHLLARNLMEWEAEWYESVYDQAAKSSKGSTGTSSMISELYHGMAECIECLLDGVHESSVLCSSPGSVGTILPVHIASVFTCQVSTLRKILEANPDAASIFCDLGDLGTMIPDRSLPIELHDNLSTDFPKWEVEQTKESSALLKWSQERSSKFGFEDCIRRSDLLFAFNPEVEFFSSDESRLKRIEARIKYEVKTCVENNNARLSKSTVLLWSWLLTSTSNQELCTSSVERVVGALNLSCVRLLAQLQNQEKQRLLDVASLGASTVIKARIDEITGSIVKRTSSPTEKIKTSKRITRGGLLSYSCRRLFDVRESRVPVAFVILPYPLRTRDGGTLATIAQEHSASALRFAAHMVKLTDPRAIECMLDEKSVEFFGCSLHKDEQHALRRRRAYDSLSKNRERLLQLYQPGRSYLYLLDEVTGVPVVSDEAKGYPVVLRDPQTTVRTLFPLMMMGLLMMRGEKALRTISDILLDKTVSTIPNSWVVGARDISSYLYDVETKEWDELQSMISYRKHFVDLASTKPENIRPRTPTTGISEWRHEIAELRALLKMNDKPAVLDTLHERPGIGNLSYWTSRSRSPHHFRRSDSDLDVLNLTRKHDELSGMLEELSVVKRDAPVSPVAAKQDPPQVITRAPSVDESQKQEAIKVLLDEALGDEGNPIEISEKYADLFEELQFNEQVETRDPRDDTGTRWNHSSRVWSEITSQLNDAGILLEEREVLQLRVSILQEAARMEMLNRSLSEMREGTSKLSEQKLALARISDRLECRGVSDGGLALARKVLLRVCQLEDRILYNEVDMQHVKIEATSIEREIEDFDPYPLTKRRMIQNRLKSKIKLVDSYPATASRLGRNDAASKASAPGDVSASVASSAKEIESITRSSASHRDSEATYTIISEASTSATPVDRAVQGGEDAHTVDDTLGPDDEMRQVADHLTVNTLTLSIEEEEPYDERPAKSVTSSHKDRSRKTDSLSNKERSKKIESLSNKVRRKKIDSLANKERPSKQPTPSAVAPIHRSSSGSGTVGTLSRLSKAASLKMKKGRRWRARQEAAVKKQPKSTDSVSSASMSDLTESYKSLASRSQKLLTKSRMLVKSYSGFFAEMDETIKIHKYKDGKSDSATESSPSDEEHETITSFATSASPGFVKYDKAKKQIEF